MKNPIAPPSIKQPTPTPTPTPIPTFALLDRPPALFDEEVVVVAWDAVVSVVGLETTLDVIAVFDTSAAWPVMSGVMVSVRVCGGAMDEEESDPIAADG